MLVFAKIKSVQNKINSLGKGVSVGFVPTMGALHEGHLSLIKRAKQENNFVVVSIYVNPTQFDKEEDLVNYPKTITADLALLENVGCNLVFIPTTKEMYGDKTKSAKFTFAGLENQMEGKFRKGHFNGVGTIVKKLLETVTPTNAYFGEKDFQQLQIIKQMVVQTKLPVHIVGCPIYREADGLAMSSRNTRLTKTYREAAPFIYKTLQKAKEKFGTINAKELVNWVQKEFKNHSLLQLEYFEIADEKTLKPIKDQLPKHKYRAFIAVFAGKIRLIDNISL